MLVEAKGKQLKKGRLKEESAKKIKKEGGLNKNST